MSELDWYHLNLWKREDEKAKSIRVVRGARVYSTSSPFTLPPLVTMVFVEDREDDLDEAEEGTELRRASER